MNKTIETIKERSKGICEYCGGPGDFRGLQTAHITHRKLGGRNGIMAKIINDSRNMALLCAQCHDRIDRRVPIKPKEREIMLTKLKRKLDWYEWKQEHEG